MKKSNIMLILTILVYTGFFASVRMCETIIDLAATMGGGVAAIIMVMIFIEVKNSEKSGKE